MNYLKLAQRIGGGPRVQTAILKVSKYAPEILTGVGIAGVIGGTILIARGATRLEPIIAKHEKDLADAKFNLELAQDEASGVDYTDKEVKKEIVRVYARTGLALSKEFAPGVSLEIFSIVAILAAHGIMKRRAVALLGAYKALEQAFAEYRARIVEEFGEEKEREISHGIKTETITDENGKKTKQKTFTGSMPNPYSKIFDEKNPNYKDTPEYNLMFLRQQQSWANDKLLINGYLFLSEVYEMLGFDITPQSRVVGWTLESSGKNDLEVDFGMYNTDVEKARDFVNGLEKSMILDFNVDGVILDQLEAIIQKNKLPRALRRYDS